jgi:hypothetical protein
VHLGRRLATLAFRRLLSVGLLPPSAPHAPRCPFVGSGNLGLLLRFRDSRLLRDGAALVGFSDHLPNRTVDVRDCAPHSAGDFGDRTS